ncbi:hypothetical protein ACT4UM_29665, partial [Bacillus sp. SS-TM]
FFPPSSVTYAHLKLYSGLMLCFTIPLYQTGRSYVMKPNVKGIVKHNISPEYSFKWAYVTEDGGKK